MAGHNPANSAPSDASDSGDLDRDLLLALDEYEAQPKDSEATDDSEPSAKRHRGAQDTGPATPALVNQQAALTDGPAPAHPLGPLALLPPELLFRVLSFLSAEDLTAAAPTCRLIQHATGSGVLWRRLFIARWGSKREDADGGKLGARPPTWKERYMERDTIEMQEVTKSVSTLLRTFYAQMTAAKRAQLLGAAAAEDLSLLDSHLAGQLAAWRRQRGLPMAPPLQHACTGRCTYSHIGGGVYVCERCGWAHACGDACTERFVDTASGMPVCPITALCFSRMMTPWEEAREADARGARCDEEATDAPEDFSVSARLGRAFVDGYNCVDEDELRRVCGVAPW